jgi:hypothetical protein
MVLNLTNKQTKNKNKNKLCVITLMVPSLHFNYSTYPRLVLSYLRLGRHITAEALSDASITQLPERQIQQTAGKQQAESERRKGSRKKKRQREEEEEKTAGKKRDRE